MALCTPEAAGDGVPLGKEGLAVGVVESVGRRETVRLRLPVDFPAEHAAGGVMGMAPPHHSSVPRERPPRRQNSTAGLRHV